MISSRTLLQVSSFLSVAYALPRPSAGVQWAPCNETTLASLECGTFYVPLDYSDPSSNETLKLDLARIPATSYSPKGSILVNFGGPGVAGRTSMASLAPMLQPLSGGEYDVITFDPRGTGDTIPLKCSDDPQVVADMANSQKSGNSSDVILGSLWAEGAIIANTCYDYAEEWGSLMGTAFVARDLMTLVDAFEDDGMLRYWGFSYGTTLGATVASMFPDRIDKMILDGVQNPHEYYHALGDFQEWTQSDDVFSGIFSECVKAPEKCPMARPGVTAEELEESVLELIESLKYNPIPLKTSVLDYTGIKLLIAQSLYSTATWPSNTLLIDKVLQGNITDEIAQAWEKTITVTPDMIAETLGLYGIHCSDRFARASSLEEFMPAVEKLHSTSVIMGDNSDALSMTCAEWKFEAKERYDGDFQVATKNPVLFIGNTYDGHTPIASAFNVSSGFEDSVVLEVNGYGHASTGLPSACVYKNVLAYWQDGTLPEEGKVCEVDAPPYGNVTWTDVVDEVNAGPQSRLFRRNAA